MDYYLTDSDTDFLRKLGFDADVIMLPGHTAGSMGIVADNVIYAGDACSSVRGEYKKVYFGTEGL